MSKKTRLSLTFMAMLAIVAFAGCGGADKAGEKVGEAIENAGEKAGEMAENAGEAVGEAAEAAGETVGEAVEKAGDTVAETIDDAKALLAEKESQLAELKQKVEAMSPQEMLSDEGKALKEKYDALVREIDEMKQKITG